MAQRDSRRLFFALWPGAKVRDALFAASRAAVADCGGKPVPLENLHLTLAFLHSVKNERVAGIQEAAAEVASRTAAFPLLVDGIGFWPRSQILYAGAAQPHDELDLLVHRLWQRLGRCGFTPERRVFRPHVTLARKAASGNGTLSAPVAWEVNGFSLVESITGQRVATYQVIGSWRLGVAG
jgi:2'-5' RNA ligase